MIEYQERIPKFPGHPWHELPGKSWQTIRLRDIYRYRFRFHGKLVEKRRYLNAYIEKEIIYAKLRGQKIEEDMLSGAYKR